MSLMDLQTYLWNNKLLCLNNYYICRVKKQPKNLSKLHQRTLKKENELKAAGYNVVSIWENDFKKQLL